MFRKKNKKGWLRILEATIAVLMISGVLIFVYSRHPDRGTNSGEYFYNLEDELLGDISFNSELRLNVLNADDTNPADIDYIALNDFVSDRVLERVGFYISICDLDSQEDFCNINDDDIFRETYEKDIFVQDVIISADLGTGDDATYNPRMLRLFMWEK